MGSDYVMLDQWRKTYFTKDGTEYIKVGNTSIPIKDLINYTEVNNSDFKTAIAEYLKMSKRAINPKRKSGWVQESARHGLAAKGIKTGRKEKTLLQIAQDRIKLLNENPKEFEKACIRMNRLSGVRILPNIVKQMEEGVCIGCGGTGYVIKMPEKKKTICRLCGGSGRK